MNTTSNSRVPPRATDHPVYCGLRDDICANPGDDVPRLILADWLEDNGQPERAEFIRVQLLLAKPDAELVPEHGDEPVGELLARTTEVRRVLKIREGELLSSNLSWSDGIAKALFSQGVFSKSERGAAHGYGDMSWTFRRGFVAALECVCTDWLWHGRAIVCEQPVTEAKLKGPLCTVVGWGYTPGVSRPPPGSRSLATYFPGTKGITVPPVIFEWLHRAPSMNAENHETAQDRAQFWDVATAERALSWAAVAWARDRAGLPQLPKPEGMTP